MATAMTVAQALAAGLALGLDRLDAQLLLLHALGKPQTDRAWLIAHDSDSLGPDNSSNFLALATRRAGGEPLAYICGHKEFFGLDLAVDKRVLVPRPDTETLVAWALEVLGAASGDVLNLGTGSGDVLDLGTGSGAVALALKHARPDLTVCATDFSSDALAVARANAARLNLAVDFSQGSWLGAVTGRFHAIVANPPYIAALDPHLATLTHEPLQALASGAGGLDDIRHIIAQAPGHLHPGGWLLLEHGFDQAAAVRSLLGAAGFAEVQSRRDLSGTERCSGGKMGVNSSNL